MINRDNKIFMLPGPVKVNYDVLNSMLKPMINHKSNQFSEVYYDCQKLCSEIFNSNSDNTFIITGSGTSGMEAAISCLASKNDNILTISNGKFGERFRSISNIYGNILNLSYKWGTSIDINQVKEFIEFNNIDIITMVHNETSTGILNPITEVGKLAKKNDILFVVDTITSFGGEYLDVKKSNIDIAISASQKCLASLPGLSIITVSDKALDKMKNTKKNTYYFDILKYKEESNKEIKSTPYTPSIPLFYALNKSLNNIIKYGISKQITRHKIYSEAIRIGIDALNLEMFPKLNKWSKYSNTLTVVKSPDNIDSSIIKSKMEERNIIISSGHDHIKNQVFRIGNMGDISFSDIIVTITHLEKIMNDYGIIDTFGNGIKNVLDFIDPFYEKY